jgi:pyrimidine-nucleoside phosphorylase
MNQPLGYAVGNALEVREAIETLHGGGPKDFRKHCLEIAGHMLRLAGRGQKWLDIHANQRELSVALKNGTAFQKFRQLVIAQDGDPDYVDHPERLPSAKFIEGISSKQTGYVSEVAADKIAQAAFELGAGREKKGETIDLAVGIVLRVKVGDQVERNQQLADIHANDTGRLQIAREILTDAIRINPTPVEKLPLFYDTIYGN